MHKPKLFLDMDGTLIRTYSLSEIEDREDLLQESRSILNGLVTIPRPSVKEFLESLRSWAAVYLFTAAEMRYALSVLDACDIRQYFEGIHSSEFEKPNSLLKTYALDSYPWLLVEDTPSSHELTQYKLKCLGTDMCQRVFMVDSFNPITTSDDGLMNIVKHLKIRFTKVH